MRPPSGSIDYFQKQTAKKENRRIFLLKSHTRALELDGEDNDIVLRVAGTYALMGRDDAAADLVKKALARGYPVKSLLRHPPLRGVVARLGIDKSIK